jgi:hypothetical protein
MGNQEGKSSAGQARPLKEGTPRCAGGFGKFILPGQLLFFAPSSQTSGAFFSIID